MHESELIIHTSTKPFFCCCYYDQTAMVAVTKEAVQLWDFLEGRMLGALQFELEMAPIAVNIIKREGQCSCFILQDKHGVVLIFTCSGSSSNLKLQSSYQIDMIGFARLPLRHYFIQQSKETTYEIKETFNTVSYPNKIETRQLLSGKVQKIYELQDAALTDITYMLTTTIGGKEYLVVAEEGATIKKIVLQSQTTVAQVHEQISVPCDQQIKIILWIEPTSPNKALVVLREDKMAVISLSELAFQRFIDFKLARILKTLSSKEGQWAVVGKKCIGLMKNEKLLKRQNIHTNLIMDMDVCKYGIIGVSQEGKLFFLSLEEKL